MWVTRTRQENRGPEVSNRRRHKLQYVVIHNQKHPTGPEFGWRFRFQVFLQTKELWTPVDVDIDALWVNYPPEDAILLIFTFLSNFVVGSRWLLEQWWVESGG